MREKMLNIVKKYGYLALLGLGIIGLILIIALSSTPKPQTGPTEDVNAGALSFGLPVLDATVVKGFDDTMVQYNETLNQYEAHLGLDFAAVANSNVYAVLDGTVTDIYTDYLDGTVMIIDHGNNFKSVYGSLSEDVNVKLGDTVKKGEVLGTVSTSSASELKSGNHLHFELLENDVEVDPAGYLNLSEK